MSWINVGYDASGNNNNWTPINIDQNTSGVNADVLVDVPTNQGTDTGAGGEVRGNYATLNPLDKGSSTSLTNGNLNNDYSGAATDSMSFSTIAFEASSSKFYAEFTYVAASLVAGGNAAVGFCSVNTVGTGDISTGGTAVIYVDDGTKYVNGSNSSYGGSWAVGDVIGVGIDNGTVTFYKNGTSQGSASTGLTGTYKFVIRGRSGVSRTFTIAANFGQRPFAYTAPSGFKALCTQNLPEPTVVDGGEYFNTVLYTGNGTSQSITGVGFAPDFVWIKNRSSALNHNLTDRVRDANGWRYLESNTTSAEGYNSQVVSALGSDGFSVGNASSTNGSGNALVAWNWKAGGTGVTNTAGTITSTVSANTTAGFSIVTYTGSGSNATVGHGLGVTPAMYIVKRRTGGIGNWAVWHTSLSNTTTSYILLDSTAAQSTSTSLWGSTAATSTTLGLGTSVTTNNSSDTYVAYCFAPVAGYSAFGSYVGSGSQPGTFTYLGFKPAFLLVKESDGIDGWGMYDDARNTYNPESYLLQAQDSGAESSAAANYIDFLSNGFRVCTGGSQGNFLNESGKTYIYAAFASNPFKISRAR